MQVGCKSVTLVTRHARHVRYEVRKKFSIVGGHEKHKTLIFVFPTLANTILGLFPYFDLPIYGFLFYIHKYAQSFSIYGMVEKFANL